MSNLIDFCESELEVIGLGKNSDDINKMMHDSIISIAQVFSDCGFSGFSAPYAVGILSKLLMFKPLVPLTGKDDEWVTHQDERTDGVMLRQNKRCSSVFQQSNRFDGQAYNIDGKVFWNWCERDLDKDEEGYPGVAVFKSYYTSSDSFVTITFPYSIPDKPEYVYVNPNEGLPQNEEGFL